jgi:hypothetical protein
MKKNQLFAGFILLLLTAAFITKAPADEKTSKEDCPASTCCQPNDNSAGGQDLMLDNLSRQFL